MGNVVDCKAPELELALVDIAAGSSHHAIFDALPIPIYTTDASGRLTHYNRAAEALCGRKPELGTDKWCVSWKLYHTDGQAMRHDECPMAQSLKEGRPARAVQAIGERPDGSRFWFEANPTPLFDPSGIVIGGINMLVDITERVNTEKSLNLRETMMDYQREALELAVANAPLEASLAVLVRSAIEGVGGDVRAGFYLANDARTALVHVVGMGEEYGKAVDGFTVGPDSLACGLATYTGEPILTSDVKEEPLWQPWLWMAEKFDYRACWSFPIKSARNRFYGTLAVYSRQPREATALDVEICRLISHAASLIISQHKSVAAQKDLEQTLRNREERHRQTLDLMPAAVYTCDADGVITYFNQRAAQLWGRQPTLGGTGERYCGSEKLILPDGTPLPHASCPMATALVEGRSFRDAEVNIQRPDGSLVSVLVNIDPLRDEQGKVVGAINTFHDISAIKQAQQALRNSEETLKEADRRKDEFLAVLAHELRNPLAPILNSVYILRRAKTHARDVERVHEMIERQVNQMVHLVDDLMEVSRITRGKIALRKESIDLASVVRNALETSTPHIEAAGHEVILNIPAEPIILEADPVRLAQTVTNLLNNAAKYTENGGRVWLTVRREPESVMISVRDSGVGIPGDRLLDVFEPFAQVERTYNRAQGGLGIGLTLAQTLVRLHGGTVEARSEGVGLGSEFIVRLPLAANQTGLPELPSKSAVGRCARRVLIVDDNRDAATSLEFLLQFLGAEVRSVNDGREALEVLQDYRPSVALLDIGMPGMNGYEVARQARQCPEGRDITLIALTGWGQDEDRRRSREAGFNHHLVKPVDPEVLQELLASIP